MKHPTDFNGLCIYESLGWNSLKLTVDELEQMCEQSWYAIYTFDDKKLVGMGRIISDGVITRHYLWCLCIARVSVHWYWKEIVERLIHHCEQNKVIPQLCIGESCNLIMNL